MRSDWMAVERERRISVSSAVMSFEHEWLAFDLLDTPCHQDFSEHGYRTLTAVDSAVIVLDVAPNGTKGASRSRSVSSSRSAGYAACQHSSTDRAEIRFDLLTPRRSRADLVRRFLRVRKVRSQCAGRKCRCKPGLFPLGAGATGET